MYGSVSPDHPRERAAPRRLGATAAVAAGLVLVACAAVSRGGGRAPNRLSLAVPSWVWVDDDAVSTDDASTSHHANHTRASDDAGSTDDGTATSHRANRTRGSDDAGSTDDDASTSRRSHRSSASDDAGSTDDGTSTSHRANRTRDADDAGSTDDASTSRRGDDDDAGSTVDDASTSRRSHRSSASDDDDDAAASGIVRTTESNGAVQTVIDQDALLDNDAVKKLLETAGLDAYSYSYGELDEYVPRSIVSRVTPSLVEGAVGADALGGYVAFGMGYSASKADGDGVELRAGWIVVMDLYGDIAQISVTYGAYIDTPSITKDAMYRPIALKLANATHFLVTLGEDDAVSGPRMLWDWRADSFTELAGGESNDAHDIAWAAEGEAFWQMDGTTSLKEWGAYDATAKALAHVKTHRLGDPNHAQLVEDDAVAYISSRSTNGIVKVNTTDDATVWVLGGEYGHFNITDFDGTTYPPGATLWAGQHNAEYFGDAEFCMFDNQYDMGNNSRLLCVTIDDEDARLASLTWEYQFDDYSTHFGDNDRLPTGNMLGCYWPMYQYGGNASADQYDERALEVTRPGGAIAWKLDLKGPACDETECERTSGEGWTFYSIERFYEAPLLYNMSCADGKLKFSAHNNFVSRFSRVVRSRARRLSLTHIPLRSPSRAETKQPERGALLRHAGVRRERGRERDLRLHAALARHRRDGPHRRAHRAGQRDHHQHLG